MAGYVLGANWEVVESYVGTVQHVVLVVCAVAVGCFVVSRLVRRRKTEGTGGEGLHR